LVALVPLLTGQMLAHYVPLESLTLRQDLLHVVAIQASPMWMAPMMVLVALPHLGCDDKRASDTVDAAQLE